MSPCRRYSSFLLINISRKIQEESQAHSLSGQDSVSDINVSVTHKAGCLSRTRIVSSFGKWWTETIIWEMYFCSLSREFLGGVSCSWCFHWTDATLHVSSLFWEILGKHTWGQTASNTTWTWIRWYTRWIKGMAGFNNSKKIPLKAVSVY